MDSDNKQPDNLSQAPTRIPGKTKLPPKLPPLNDGQPYRFRPITEPVPVQPPWSPEKWHMPPLKDYTPPNGGRAYYFRDITEPVSAHKMFKPRAVGPSERLAHAHGAGGSNDMDQRIRDMHRVEGLRAARGNLAGCKYAHVQEQPHSTTLPPRVERVLFDLIAVTNHHLSLTNPGLSHERQAEEAMAVLADELLTALEERTGFRLERQAEEDHKRMEHDKLDLPHLTTDEAVLRQHSGAFVVEPKGEE